MSTSGDFNEMWDSTELPLSGQPFSHGARAGMIKPPVRFAHPAPRRASRSPSRSPSRRHGRSGHDIHPMIAERSPDSTLEALTTALSAWADGQESHDALGRSVAGADPVERAVAVRVAMASKQLRRWYAEVSAWEWPVVSEAKSSTGFEVPTFEERAQKRRKISEDTHEHIPGSPQHSADFEFLDDDEYWGGCPARLVRQRLDKIDLIKDGIDELELEDLKSRVLDAHNPSRSRPSSSYDSQLGTNAAGGITRLDDMTAITTATLLQALPCLARLLGALETWSARLAVLRMVPAFLDQVQDTQVALESAWRAIGPRTTARGKGAANAESGAPVTSSASAATSTKGTLDEGSGPTSKSEAAYSDLTRTGLAAIQAVLAGKVGSLGRKVDRMLDTLEGREDTIPSDWIEEMEMLERDYGNWVFEAENVVLQNELRETELRSRSEAPPTHPEDPILHQETVATNVTPPSFEGELPTPDEGIAYFGGGHAPGSDTLSDLASDDELSTPQTGLHDQPGMPTRKAEPSTPTSRPKHPDRGLSEPAPVESGRTRDAAVATTPRRETGSPAAPFEEPLDTSQSSDPHMASIAPIIAHQATEPQPANPKIGHDSISRTPMSPPRPTMPSRSKTAPATAPLTTSAYETDSWAHTGYDLSIGEHEARDSAQPDSGSLGSKYGKDYFSTDHPKPINIVHADEESPDPEDHGQLLDQAETTHTDHEIDHTSMWDATQAIVSAEPHQSLITPSAAHITSRTKALGQANGDHLNGGSSVVSEQAIDKTSSKSKDPVTGEPSSTWLRAGFGPGAPQNLALRRQSNRSSEVSEPALQGPADKAPTPEEPSNQSRTVLSAVPAPIDIGGPTIAKAMDPLSASSLISDFSSPELRDAFAAVSHKPVFVDNTVSTSVALPVSDGTPQEAEAIAAQGEDWPKSDTPARTKEHRRSLSLPLETGIRSPSGLARSISEGSGGSVDNLNLFPANRTSLTSIPSTTSIEPGNISPSANGGLRRRSSLPSSKSPARLESGADYQSAVSTPSPRVNYRTGSPSPDGTISSPKSRHGPHSLEAAKDSSKQDGRLAMSSGGSPKSRKADASRRPAGTSSNVPKHGRAGTSKRAHASEPHTVNLEDKISSILTTIPAHIRLTSTPDADLEQSNRYTTTPQTAPWGRSRRNTSTSDSYTLAPAAASSSSSQASNVRQEGKLFHLRRAGQDAPIKLFVRLVGPQNERVMVRVGGGWSELGEYLRDYALHHSRRSNSDTGGLVEVTRLPSGTPSSSRVQSTGEAMTPDNSAGIAGNGGSRPSSVLGRPRPSPTTPYSSTSSLAVRKTRLSSYSPGTPTVSQITTSTASPDEATISTQPGDNKQTASSSSSPSTSPVSTSAPPLAKDLPLVKDIKRRDSAGGSQSTDSKRRVSRRAEPLSAEKQAWVEDMIGKVRRGASATFQNGGGVGGGGSGQGTPAASSSTNRVGSTTPTSGGAEGSGTPPPVNFGELGTVGRTRRLFRKDTPT